MDFYFKCTLYIVLYYLQRQLAAECVQKFHGEPFSSPLGFYDEK